MGDPYDEFLASATQQAPSTGPAPVQTGAGEDAYAEFLNGATPAAPVEKSYPGELGRLFAGGVDRNIAQWQSMPNQLLAIHHELQGNTEESARLMGEAQKTQAPTGDSEWNLQKIHDVESFSYWMAEKLGEQSITALASMGTGLGGGLAVNAAAQNLAARGAIGAVSHRAMVLAGMTVPTYALTTAMETAGTAEEQFQVTGSTQPQRSIPAGMVKGVLELWTPLSISKALLTPGLQLGKTLPGAIAKLSAKEAATETAQEAVDIHMRKLAEPGYSYFKDGPTLAPSGWGDGMWRLAESGAAGGLVGAAFGGPAAVMERRQERNKELGNEPPGFEQTLPPEQSAPLSSQMIARDNVTIEKEGRHWTASSQFGNVFAVLDRVPGGTFALRVQSSGLERERDMNQGHGAALYKEMFDQALNQDYPVHSDDVVSTRAARVYEGFRKFGYTVEGPRGKLLEDAAGSFYHNLEGPVYKITAGPSQKLSSQMAADLRLLPSADKTAFQHTYNKVFGQVLANREGIPAEESESGVKAYPAANRNFPVTPNPNAAPGSPDRILFDKKMAEDKEYYIQHRKEQENRWAQERRKEFRVVGPVTELHNTVVPKKPGGDKLTSEMRAKVPHDDAIGMSAFLDPKLRVENRNKDIIEAATERYAEIQPDGQLSSRLYTNTEWELENATNRGQGEKPRLLKVRQDMLQIGAITAHLTDLAAANSERVWFLPGVDAATKQRVLRDYAALQVEAVAATVKALNNPLLRNALETHFKPLYDELLTAGLRVIPSHGAGFYYNGVIEGEEVKDLKTTGRSQRIMFYNVMTGGLTPFTNADFSKEADYIPVSVDENKLQAGDIIKGENGLSDRLKTPLRFDKLTPGVKVLVNPTEELYAFHLGFQNEDHTYVIVTDLKPESNRTARAFQQVFTKLAPAVDKILESLGIDQKMGIWITDNMPVHNGVKIVGPAWVDLRHGVIGFSPEAYEKATLWDGPLEVLLPSHLMHELGHQITYWYYRNLPVDVQDKLMYAWEKARLSLRMGDTSRITQMGVVDQRIGVNAEYWSGFTEWLAEQFRRWAGSDSEVKSWLDKAFKEGAQTQERFYREWEKKVGPDKMANLLHPDYYSTAFYDYLRGFSQEKNAFKQVLKRDALYEVGQSLLDSPVKFQVLKQVDLGLRSLEGLLLPGQMIRINEFLDPKLTPAGDQTPGGTTARYIHSPNGKELGLIELALGSLKPEFAYAHGRATGFHETAHAYIDMGLMTKEEQAVILQDVRGKEDFYYPKDLRLANQARHREAKKAMGWTDEQVLRAYEANRNEEYIVYYLQDVVMKGQPARSEAGGKVAAMFAAVMERIADFMHAIGFPTRESVIRALFRGEFVARYEKRLEQNAVDGWLAEQQGLSSQMAISSQMAFWPFGKKVNPNEDEIDALGRYMYEVRKWKSPKPIEIVDPDARRAVFEIWRQNGNKLKDAIATYKAQPKTTTSATASQAEEKLETAFDRAMRTSQQRNKLSSQMAQQPEQKVKTVEVEPGVLMHVRYMENQELRNAKGRLYNAAVHYLFTDQQGNLVGSASLKNRGDRGFEIGNVSAQAATVGKLSFLNGLLKHVAKDVGIPLWNPQDLQNQLAKPAGELTGGAMPAYRFAFRKTEMASWLDMYVYDQARNAWFSPNSVVKNGAYWKLENVRSKQGRSRHSAEKIAEMLALYTRLYAKIPAETWQDPRLRQMFSLDKNYKRDEVQGSLIRAGQQVEESKLMASLGYGHPMQDVFQNTFEVKQAFSQAEQAKASGLPFDMAAPRSALTSEMRRTWEKLTGYGESTEARKSIMNTFHEADRIGKYSKYAWTIWQLIWKNEKIVPLTSLGQNTMRMNTLMNGWLRRADETARVWRKITDPKRREGITNTLFGLMEMQYRLPSEVANKIVRMPSNYVETMPGMADGFLDGRPVVPGGELDRFFKKTGLDPQDHEMVRRVGQDFWQFLRDVEEVRKKNLTNTLAKSPQALQAALTDLAKEMSEIRSKPYFPMMRWGEYTVKVKDVQTKELLEFQAFGTRMQRDAAVPEMRQKHPGADIQIGRIASSSVEFMSLPSPLLKTIKEKLFDKAGKTPEQVQLIDQQIAEIEAFELANRPDRTFRKRWMPAHGIPGYNTDAFRAYASYFQYGSRYLARLAYMDDLYADLAALQKSSDDLGNTAKREEIVKYVRDWLKYIMEPGRDSGKFRAVVSLWYLGFSPAAAAMNLTQTLTTTLPTLYGHFGREAVTRSMTAGWTASKNVYRTNAPEFLGGSGVVSGAPSYIRAREEMLRQQQIDVGQAPELAAFAEGGNLAKMQAGSKTQEYWLTMLNWGMKMFQVGEQHNRELAFKLSWDLANKYPRTKRLLDLDSIYPIEVKEIMSRANLTHQEAVAFIFAREMIMKTQLVYDKTSDAPFMRGKSKDFLIFFKYTQGMLYAFGNNGAMLQMMLIFAFLYGLNGLPGAEDAAAIVDMLDAIGRKFFGKDFRLRFKAREFFTQATAGTPFEKVGPDLALHGVSRYGFGMSFLPSPFAPQFDASSNGSMGRIIPGFAEFMHGQATGKKWPDVFAEAAQKASGAGYGTFFALMNFLSEGPSADSKKWESVIPRFAKAEAKAWRYGVSEQAETTRSGAKLPSTRFFAGDPDDVATVLAQAVGFQPRKVSQTWEALRAVHEEEEIYKGRRTAIYVQLDKAIQEKNQAALDEVKAAIDKYNADVKGFDPSYQIGREIMASLRQRQLQRAMVEETSMQNKKQITIMDRMQKLYPGVDMQKVK